MARNVCSTTSSDAAGVGRRRSRLRAALATLVLGSMAGGAHGAGPPIRFDHLSLEDGLSQTTVLAILQDQRGSMWFGTEDGLNRYDGYGFEHFRRRQGDPGSVGGGFIWGLVEDAAGNLWIGADGGGVSRFERATGEFSVHRHLPDNPDSVASDRVRALAVDRRGQLWIGTFTEGVSKLDPSSSTFSHFRHREDDPASLSDNRVYALAVDSGDAVWVGTDGGLDRIDPDTGVVSRVLSSSGGSARPGEWRVRAICEDRDGALWVGTHGGGLHRVDPATGQVTSFRHDPDDPSSLSHDRVRTVLEDREGRLWVGTLRGLNLHDRVRGTFTRYLHDPANPASLSGDDVVSIHQDRSGVMWFGTQAKGLNRWNPNTWSFGLMTHEPGDEGSLSDSNVTSFCEDGAGNLWIGTFGGGLNVVDRSTGRVRHLHAGKAGSAALSDDRVMALLHTRDDKIWIGTLGGGLDRYDPSTGRVTAFRHEPADPRTIGAMGVMALFQDSRGRLWVGTFGGGVNRFDPGSETFERFPHDPEDPGSVSGGRVTCFTEDRSGRLWVGTEGGGLNLLDPRERTMRRFQHDPDDPRSLSGNTVFALHADDEGRVWVGTRGGGLDLVDDSGDGHEVRFTNYSTDDGLANDVVYGIEEDGRGRLWISTNLGLSVLDTDRGFIAHYLRSHGLQGNEFNFGAHHRGRTGELMFGGPEGCNVFVPEKVSRITVPPAVVMTAIRVMNAPLETTVPVSELRSIDLSYRDVSVTFEFAALDYAAPRENRYSCTLEGFDHDWVDLGRVRRVTYTNLDGGEYTLRVRAANSDGVWNEEGLSLVVRVAPPPWETWWAYFLYLLAVGLVAGGYVMVQQARLRREEAYARRLEADVSDRTAELAQRNAELELSNRKLNEATLTDPLTGLANRRFLFELIDHEVALVRRHYADMAAGTLRAESFDLMFMMIDIDHFKEVNDTFGHLVGDLLLTQFRDILKGCCRSSDFLIRWGGDEFLIVGRDTAAGGVQVLAERVRSRIEDSVFDLGTEQLVRATCSIGFSSYPFLTGALDLLSWEQVLNVAERALLVAKSSGRNTWVGLHANELTPTSGVFSRIQDDLGGLYAEQLIDISSAVGDRRQLDLS